MYDTLMMLKPNVSLTTDELHSILIDITRSMSRNVERDGNRLRVTTEGACLAITWNDSPHVMEESNEIAERFGVPSRGCRARFEMAGEDPDMELLNDYMLINEELQATGNFVIFDTQECRLLFD